MVRTLFGLLILLSCAPALVAQSSRATATVRGVVLDSSEAAIPAATINVRNQDTGAERRSESDAAGGFSISGLPPGVYTLEIEASGFATIAVKPFVLAVGQTATQTHKLQPADLVERIEVREEPEGIDVTTPTASVALGNERIEEAPARSRNYLNFILAAPAAAPSANSSSQRTMTGTRAPLSDSGFTFAGMRPRTNAIQIDGLDNRDETTGGNRVAIGLEMVQEFRVAGSSVGAELGGAAGGLLNVVTRSGTNLWHGDVTMFAQNEIFNARRAEVALDTRPRFRRYQPGVSANGPLRRDRTFISGAVELERESAEEWSNVPASAAAEIEQALASPRYAGSGLTVFRGLYPTSTRGVEASLKLNHQVSEKDALSTRYAFSRGRVLAEVQGPDNFADRSAQGNALTTDHSLVGDWLRVVSPRVVNDFRVQVAERGMELSPNARGPMIEIPGVVTLGGHYLMDADRVERHYQIVENLGFSVGGHRLSVGADVHAVTLDADLRNRWAGIYVFPTLEAFLQGRPDVFSQAFGDSRTSPATVPLGLWAQDRWEIRSGLQLELGLRFDRQFLPDGLSTSSNNAAPRVGLAWKPVANRPLVLRAGFGLFYDRYPLAFLNEALQKNGLRGFEQYAVGDGAVRALALSGGGALAAPLSGVAPSAYRTSASFPSTYSRKLNTGAEYALDKDTSLSIEANLVRGLHLPRVRNIAGGLPPLYELEQTAKSEYMGASVSVNRRMTRELAYLVGYTVGRTNDDGSDFDEHPLDPLDIRRDWARSQQHQMHRFAASAVFELPVEEAGWMPEGLAEALEGVSFAPILSLPSGRPVNALLTTDAYRTGAYPLSARPQGMARNRFRSPSTASLDLRVMKTFLVNDGRAFLQIGVESFNLANHMNTERVSRFYGDPRSPLATHGQTLESLPPRQIQFLVQFEY